MFLAAGLILAVVLYELTIKRPATTGASAASAGARVGTTTNSATATSGLSQLLNSLLKPTGPTAPAASGGGSRPSSGGSGGAGSFGPTQTGFNQPSNQSVPTAAQLTEYGLDDVTGKPVWIDNTGQVWDSQGNPMSNLSGITPYVTDLGIGTGPNVITQTAPGDGAAGSMSLQDLLNLSPSQGTVPDLQVDSTGQDIALAQDTQDFSIPPDDSWFD